MGRPRGPRKPPAQKKPPLTHFLCLPLVTKESRPQLEAAIAKFKNDVCPQDSSTEAKAEEAAEHDRETVLPTIHPKAVRPVGALHCTLGVMSLDRDKLTEAVEYLEGIDIAGMLRDVASKSATTDEPASDAGASERSTLDRPISLPSLDRPKPFVVDLKGLTSMHSPEKTSILYSAPNDASERLRPFCLRIQQTFKDKGFLVEDNRDLKLHATVVNTIYSKGKRRPGRRPPSSQTAGTSGGQGDQPQGHGPNANAPLKIDATAILEKYKDFVWAEQVMLDRVAICEMGAKKMTDDSGNIVDEVYTEIASVALPT
ncbi:uncharacterized protein LTR77_000823 [Saxophila tyrrhenica]|uniref:A-kinase anchor protein 7-like phosphoesterase domain-containing protein n=1 Tax=Saxophila tyrrhenica TaxID=1690608 RepID=A0AAV9PNQ4_9PEZI|nr:hypothetical protein LTR77_000823 [Saxophila tyrrhenica]